MFLHINMSKSSVLLLAVVLLFIPIILISIIPSHSKCEDYLTDEQTLDWEKTCSRCGGRDITGNSNNGAVWANDPDGPNGESGLGWVL